MQQKNLHEICWRNGLTWCSKNSENLAQFWTRVFLSTRYDSFQPFNGFCMFSAEKKQVPHMSLPETLSVTGGSHCFAKSLLRWQKTLTKCSNTMSQYLKDLKKSGENSEKNWREVSIRGKCFNSQRDLTLNFSSKFLGFPRLVLYGPNRNPMQKFWANVKKRLKT